MTTATKLTVEQFLDLPEKDLIYELVEGEAIAKMSPKRFHSCVTGTLYTFLGNWSKNKGEVGIEWAITLKRNGKDWVRCPRFIVYFL